MASSRASVRGQAQEAQRRMQERLAQLAAATGDDTPAAIPPADAEPDPIQPDAPDAITPLRDESDEVGSIMLGRVPQAATLDITLVDEDTTQYRKFPGPYSDDDPGAGVPELADTIRSRGLLQPVVVRPDDGRYRVIVGARRLRAFRHLAGRFPDEGWTYIPAIVWTGPVTRATLIAMQIIENDARRNPDPASRRRAYLALHQELGGNARRAMRMLGIGHTTWYRVTGEPADDQVAPAPPLGKTAASRTSVGQLRRILEAYVDRVPKLEPDQAALLEQALTGLLEALRSRAQAPAPPAEGAIP